MTPEEEKQLRVMPDIGLTNKSFLDDLNNDPKKLAEIFIKLNKDIEYVAFCIIKDHEKFGYLNKKTAMLPGEYVFVSEKTIYEHIG